MENITKETSLLISIKPKHLLNILNGKKTLELRKTVPKDFKGWVYIYCTKGIKDILYKYKDKYYTQHYLTFTDSVEVLNSKVVARFWLNEYEEYYFNDYQDDYRLISKNKDRFVNATIPLEELCLSNEEINNYGKGKILYTWFIKNLEIFDIPLSLGNFYKENDGTYHISDCMHDKDCMFGFILRKPPQSYQYVQLRS